MKLQGKKITLLSAQPTDKKEIYNWMAHSDLTSAMMGPPHFPDSEIPSYEAFCDDYLPHFFDGTQPTKGRCFIIFYKEERVGQINFDTEGQEENTAELDIWLKSSKYTGQGLGTDALLTLSDYLLEELGFETLLIAPSARNKRAVRSYQKAGFVETGAKTKFPDYEDALTLAKNRCYE